MNLAKLRSRCCVDPSTGCWHWLGAKDDTGSPRIYTFDHERGEKRPMSGPKAVWNMAHDAAPAPGFLVMRSCLTTDCVNPVHVKEVRSQAEIGLHIKRSGAYKGRKVSSMEGMRKGWAARGLIPTDPQIVSMIRLSPPEVSGVELAARTGISATTVSRIRRYQSNGCNA